MGSFSPTFPRASRAFPLIVLVVLTLVAAGAVKGPLTVGLAPSSARALQVVPSEGGVRGSGCILAGVRVILREEGWVGPQLIPLEGQEGLARLEDEGIGDVRSQEGKEDEQMDERRREVGRGGGREAAVLEQGVLKTQREQRERLAGLESLWSLLDTMSESFSQSQQVSYTGGGAERLFIHCSAP